MKKTLTTFVLFIGACVAANAQSEVLFKMKMLPDHDYLCNMKMNMDMNMAGSAQTGGAPMSMQMEMGINMDMKTGAVNSKKEFPISMSMQMSPSTMTMNGKTTPMPVAATAMPNMYGKCTLDGLPRIDSIPGMVMNDSLRTAMNKMMETYQNNIKFPDKPMKIGDTFTQDMPFNLPIMGSTMKSSATVVYKLISITGNKANFDIAYNMDMNTDASQKLPVAMHISGSGTGTMEYDMTVNYPTHCIQNMDMNMTMPVVDKPMVMKMKMKMDMQAVVK